MPEGPEILDEHLMAFADGELHGAERDRVADYVSRHPEARARVAMFAAARDVLARSLNSALVEPVPERLLATVMGGQALNPQDAGHANPLPKRRASLWGIFSRFTLAVPVAAFAASAAAGFFISTHLLSHEAPPLAPSGELVAMKGGLVVAAGPLADALETFPGDKPALLASSDGPATWTPVVTFETQDGRFCRQYALTTGQGAGAQALACRSSASAQWHIETSLPLGASSGKPKVDVSGRDGEIEDKVSTLIKGNAITGAEEQALIAHHWAK